MNDLLRLTDEQMQGIEPYFTLSHGTPRVDDRRVFGGIIFLIRNRSHWRDASGLRSIQDDLQSVSLLVAPWLLPQAA